jgi:hypothetical protein
LAEDRRRYPPLTRPLPGAGGGRIAHKAPVKRDKLRRGRGLLPRGVAAPRPSVALPVHRPDSANAALNRPGPRSPARPAPLDDSPASASRRLALFKPPCCRHCQRRSSPDRQRAYTLRTSVLEGQSPVQRSARRGTPRRARILPVRRQRDVGRDRGQLGGYEPRVRCSSRLSKGPSQSRSVASGPPAIARQVMPERPSASTCPTSAAAVVSPMRAAIASGVRFTPLANGTRPIAARAPCSCSPAFLLAKTDGRGVESRRLKQVLNRERCLRDARLRSSTSPDFAWTGCQQRMTRLRSGR